MGDCISVQTKGKTVITNAEGVFSIEAPVGETVNLTYIGMLPLNFKVTNSTENPVLQMEEGVSTLNEIVVTRLPKREKGGSDRELFLWSI